MQEHGQEKGYNQSVHPAPPQWLILPKCQFNQLWHCYCCKYGNFNFFDKITSSIMKFLPWPITPHQIYISLCDDVMYKGNPPEVQIYL